MVIMTHPNLSVGNCFEPPYPLEKLPETTAVTSLLYYFDLQKLADGPQTK